MTRTLPKVIRLGKGSGTRGNIPFGKLRRMDESWRHLEGTWDRLRWARLRKFGTAKDAADALGERPNTYSAYERRPNSSKHIALDHQNAAHFAKKLGVRWEWLLLGEGQPFTAEDEATTMIKEAVSKAAPERRQKYAAAIVALLTGTDG
jgi:hypothetical protein